MTVLGSTIKSTRCQPGHQRRSKIESERSELCNLGLKTERRSTVSCWRGATISSKRWEREWSPERRTRRTVETKAHMPEEHANRRGKINLLGQLRGFRHPHVWSRMDVRSITCQLGDPDDKGPVPFVGDVVVMVRRRAVKSEACWRQSQLLPLLARRVAWPARCASFRSSGRGHHIRGRGLRGVARIALLRLFEPESLHEIACILRPSV